MLFLFMMGTIMPAISARNIVATEINQVAAICGTNEYPSIQQAINQALPNATIIVTAGAHNERLTVNKSLIIRGYAPETTKLTAISGENNAVLTINAQGVTIVNLSVYNKAQGLYTTGISVRGSHTTISHCILQDTPIGIAVWSSHTTITRCTFCNCTDEGIALLGSSISTCDDTRIIACVFLKNGDGIELQRSSENLIADCCFYNNTHAGIDMIKCLNRNNSVNDCSFSSNYCFGMYCASAPSLSMTHCTILHDCIELLNTKGCVLSSSTITEVRLLDNTSLFIDQPRQIACINCDPTSRCFFVRQSESIKPPSQVKISFQKYRLQNLQFLP